MHTETELFAIAAELGLTDECAREMVAEHIARRDARTPRYVRIALCAARSADGREFKIGCRKAVAYLDRVFGFNVENVHQIGCFYVNRNKATGSWYVCA